MLNNDGSSSKKFLKNNFYNSLTPKLKKSNPSPENFYQ